MPLPAAPRSGPDLELALVRQPLVVDPSTSVFSAWQFMQRARSEALAPGDAQATFWFSYYRSARSGCVVVVKNNTGETAGTITDAITSQGQNPVPGRMQVLGVVTEREILDCSAQLLGHRVRQRPNKAEITATGKTKAQIKAKTKTKAKSQGKTLAEFDLDRDQKAPDSFAPSPDPDPNPSPIPDPNPDLNPNSDLNSNSDPDRELTIGELLGTGKVVTTTDLLQSPDWQRYFQDDPRPIAVIDDQAQLQGTITPETLAIALLQGQQQGLTPPIVGKAKETATTALDLTLELAELTTELAIETDPAIKPATAPAADSTINPAIKPAADPAIKPAIKPATAPAADPAIKPATAPATDPAIKPAIKPATAPAADPAIKPAIKPATAPAAAIKPATTTTTAIPPAPTTALPAELAAALTAVLPPTVLPETLGDGLPDTLLQELLSRKKLIEMGPETPIEMALLQAYRTQMHRALEVAQRQQQQAANTLWDHEQRLHGAIQHAPFPLMIHAEDGEVLTISEIWTELTGYTHQDLPTTAVWAKLAYGDRSAPSPPQSSQTTEQALATWANSEKIITTRNRGQRIWRFSAAPFGFLADGRRLIVVVATDLTQERQQTQLMQSREARYRALMEGASNAIIVANCEGFIIDANQKAEELFGYAQVHLIQLHIFQLCLPADWPGIQRGFQEIVAGTRRDFPDTRIVRRDRQVIPVDISSTTIEIEGTLIVQAIIRDIRERKKTERKLKRMSDRLTLALEAAEIGCWEWDIINNQLIWDDRSYELHGISWASGDRSITYEHWLSLIHPDDTEPVKTLIQQALAGNPNYRSDYGTATPYQVDYRVIHSTGQVHYHRTHGTVLRNSQQQPQRMIGVTFDISQQKQAEIALRRSESNFRRLAENIPAVIYRHLYHPHHTSTFIYINPYVQTIYGLDPGEVIQEAAVLFNQIHPDDVAAFWRALETAAQHLEPFDSEHRIITVAGDLKWVKVSAAPTPLPEGGTLWQGVIWDVSERCEAQAKLQEQNRSLAHFNQQLERSTRLKDEFLANMSHELRTPLNAILGLTEGLQEEVFGPLHPKQFHCLRTIEESASHLLALITDILDISKIEAGQIELEYTRIAVLPFCQASLTFIRQAALRKEIQVKLDIPAALPDIWADERRLRQALMNLLSNAVKFTPANGTITLKATRIETDDPQQRLPTLRLRVTDTGIGIAEEHIPRLFQPFVQVDSALNRQYAGTGLGLALVKQIAELHGGQVSLSSQLTIGSCFTLEVPYLTHLAKIAKKQPESPGIDHPTSVSPRWTGSSAPSPIGPRTLGSQSRDFHATSSEATAPAPEAPPAGSAPPDWATPPQGLGHRAAPGDSQTVQGGNPAKLQPELQLELQPDLQPDLQAPSGAPTAPPGPANPAPTPPALGDPSASPQTTSNFSFLGPTSPLFPRSPWPSAANTLHDRSISLLLAEDNEANIITLKSYLEAKGYRLQVVRDGQEALAAIERSAFDLILLDIQMPGLDGLSVMRSIRNGTALPNVPIIALTALAMKGDQERCLAAGATNYIHKPIRMNQLHHLIQETLGLSH